MRKKIRNELAGPVAAKKSRLDLLAPGSPDHQCLDGLTLFASSDLFSQGMINGCRRQRSKSPG